MKLLSSLLFRSVLFLAAIVLMQSCGGCSGKSVGSRLNNVVNDDVDFVVTGDVARTLDQLDIQVKDGKLVLPDYMTDLIDEMGRRFADDVEETLDEFKGLDYGSMVVAGKIGKSGADVIISFGVNDVNAFYNFLSDKNSDVEKDTDGDYITIGNNSGQILIKDTDAYVLIHDGDFLKGGRAVRRLEDWLEKASDNPLASWKKDYLTRESIGAAWLSNKIIEMSIRNTGIDNYKNSFAKLTGQNFEDLSMGMRLNLDGAKATGNLTVFDGDKVMKNPFSAKIDTGLLKYATESDLMAMAMAADKKAVNMLRVAVNRLLDQEIEYYKNRIRESEESDDRYFYYGKDYYVKKLADMTEMRKFLNLLADNIEGSAMLAMGPVGESLRAIDRDPMRNMHMVLAVNCKKDAVQTITGAMVDIFKNVASDNLIVTQTSGGYKVADRDETSVIYIVGDGNNVVVSNFPVERDGKNRFDKSVFEGTWSAAQIVVPDKMSLPENLTMPYGVDVRCKADEMSFDSEMAFDGTKKNFVPTMISMFVEFKESLQRR